MAAVEALRAVLGRLETALAAISNGLVISDENGLIIWSNLSFQQLLNKSSLELLSKPLTMILCDLLTEEQINLLELGSWSKTCKERFIIQRNPLIALEIERNSISNPSDQASIMQIRDISTEATKNQLESLIQSLIEKAPNSLPELLVSQLTKQNFDLHEKENDQPLRENPTANRVALITTLANQYDMPNETSIPVYIMHCRLCDLLDIQYLHGHQAEQSMIKTTKEKVQRLIGKGDFLSQISADSLVIASSTIKSLPEAMQLGEQLLHLFSHPFNWKGRTLLSRVSIGITRSSKRKEGFEELLIQAEQAAESMQKHAGVRLYQP